MKVWLVVAECECNWYGGEEIKKAFDSEEKAKDYIAKHKDGKWFYTSELEVE
ncbi:hypothetical protein SEA_WOFFORD_162 [Streptomyces phage Wofford]|uniref:DUF7336 domain-containing protein n=1 Tax=Streptomyces phage Wofford TaxID=2283267 RepID=A0A345M9Z9_9CAUD|nr:hypothetical protein HWB78_gp135 [Streptomyces phage Wollford]AXH67320.1 hypothetical protein SEA_WOFFORD_162 [Streptomyces phage Wollford]